MEQPVARQSRLERRRERDHEHRAMEQPEVRRSTLERYASATVNNEQLNRLTQDKPGLHQTGRLTNGYG